MKKMFPVFLLLALFLMLGHLAGQHPKQWDLTQNGRNSLYDATLQILGNLKGPVTITSYASKNDPKFGDVQKAVSDFLAPYLRAKPDIRLKFVDPVMEPKLAEKAGVSADGEMVIEYGGRSEHLRALNEESIDNLFIRLERARKSLVMALSGHGERKIDGVANFDLGEFGKRLAKNGFETGSLNLAIAQGIPENMSLLVITTPQVDLMPGEVKKIENYVEKGGDLLWLVDPEDSMNPLHGLQPLADEIGLSLSPGVVIDPAAVKLGAPPNWALGTLYGTHPVTSGFSLVTVFPVARQIGFSERGGWKITPLVEAAQQGWVSVSGKPQYDPSRDIRGPVDVLVAFERRVGEKDQRIVVAGTGEFLANAYIGNGGNLDLGVNLVNWLANDERMITLQPRATLDSNLRFTKTSASVLAIGLLFGIPLGFVSIAAFLGWRRRAG